MEKILRLIARKEARIGIIGLGYVGLPLAREFLKAGFCVLGFDVDPVKVEKINRGESYIKHIQSDFIVEYVRERKRFEATGDFDRLGEADAVLICVPTPLGRHNEPDLTYVLDSTRAVAARLRRGQIVVLESTTYPGTTDEEMLPLLEAGGLRCGQDFFLGFSPEREDPGNPRFSTGNTPKVVSGITPGCLQAVNALYQAIVTTVPVSTTRVAEATKILENTYRAVNIALVNELKMLLERMDVDVWEVIEAAKTKPFGFSAFYPGPGLGGHCIPIDPFYLTWKAREYGLYTRFIELAGEVNTDQPFYVCERVAYALNQLGRAVHGSRILVLGVAYKRDVDDMRESPAFRIIELLGQRGAGVDYYDPLIPRVAHLHNYPGLTMDSIEYSPQAVAAYDAVVLVTDHSSLPYAEIEAHARLIVDTRNAFRGKSKKIVKA